MRAVLILCLVSLGCAKSKSSVGYHDDSYFGEAEYASVSGKGAPAARPSAPPPPPPPAAPSGRQGQSATSPRTGGVPPGQADLYVDDEPESPAEAEKPQAAARMVHYDGFATLRATRIDEALDEVGAVADAVGGRVERLAGDVVSIRVPVGRFKEAWEAVLKLGDVLDQSVRADDVTEQFTAMDLRTRTLRATRDRLVALLAKATEENEKLALLWEITRVTEQLDAVEAQLRTLADLASYARISVRVVPREAFAGSAGPELAGFEWIRGLSPFRRAVHADTRRLALPEPEGLVSLSQRGPFVAESADGAVLWTMRVPNDPVGDGAFWIAAVEQRIGEEFSGTALRDVGSWSCLEMEQPGADEPYHWRVCAQAAGRYLHVAQAFFPGPEQVERYAALVDDALIGGDS